MPDRSESVPKINIAVMTVVVIIIIALFLFVISWLMTRGVADNNSSLPASNDQANEQLVPEDRIEPTNPNVTGGSSGVGEGESNDPSIEKPSPAGGVDTNQVPAGGTSPVPTP